MIASDFGWQFKQCLQIFACQRVPFFKKKLNNNLHAVSSEIMKMD